ncbi:MAG: alcohol dehydrogenase catalytic domain-containing protein [Actinomycetota bacterium]|nr:alcohol dehydrogenase catalytic domain-containing protein [Actinomycetota bacterium]
MRAVVVNPEGRPRLADVPEPNGDGELVRVLACGLCGSDVEKLDAKAEGMVLGHEVVAETVDGRRVVLVHHRPCGACARCRGGHESTCDAFRAATIVPGGFAERVTAGDGYVELPAGVDAVLGTYAEPLACVLRGAERIPRGDVLVVGGGFVGRLFAEVLARRGDRIYIHDLDPARSGPEPIGPVDAVVVTAPGGGESGLTHARPGGFVLVFASGGRVELDRVYRDEVTVVGSRSATPRHLAAAVELLPTLELPPAAVLPLERFQEGLDAYRSRRVLKVVFVP